MQAERLSPGGQRVDAAAWARLLQEGRAVQEVGIPTGAGPTEPERAPCRPGEPPPPWRPRAPRVAPTRTPGWLPDLGHHSPLGPSLICTSDVVGAQRLRRHPPSRPPRERSLFWASPGRRAAAPGQWTTHCAICRRGRALFPEFLRPDHLDALR